MTPIAEAVIDSGGLFKFPPCSLSSLRFPSKGVAFPITEYEYEVLVLAVGLHAFLMWLTSSGVDMLCSSIDIFEIAWMFKNPPPDASLLIPLTLLDLFDKAMMDWPRRLPISVCLMILRCVICPGR